MPKGVARLDNRLAFLDQATFLSLRATGRAQLAQIVWIYEHPLDLDGLRRVHSRGGYGLLGRRIERSPLPFGRHRWVSALGPSSDIDIAERARPRAELSDWADERVQLPIDPELGPGWHIAVLPLTDGSAAVSAVISHCLADGIGGMLTIINAVNGNLNDFGYPQPHSRTRLRALVTDARETVQGAPEAARAFGTLAKLLFRRSHDVTRPAASPAVVANGTDCNVVVPAVTVHIDLDHWDDRAKTLHGTSYSLLAGFAAKLGERMGRRRAEDGAVTLVIPITDRTLDDTRANAMSHVNVNVDPTQLTTDLSDARAVLREALKTARDGPDPASQFLALTPFVPKRALTRVAGALFGFADFPVVCSNLGDLPPEIARADGTEAEYVVLRGVDQNVTRRFMESVGGQLVVVGARLVGKMSVSVVGYQPGGINSRSHLRELAVNTLAEFGLTGVID